MLLGQFVDNLERTVVEPSSPGSSSTSEVNGSSPDAAVTEGARQIRPVAGTANEPVDLLKVAGTPVTKRVVPLVGAVVVTLILARLISRSRRRRARRRASAI
jgi:hypothetical protein